MLDLVASQQQVPVRARQARHAAAVTASSATCASPATAAAPRTGSSDSGRRARPQLSVPGLQGVLPPRRPADALHGRAAAADGAPSEIVAHYAAEDAKRGRNDPCTCGSGPQVEAVPRDLTVRSSALLSDRRLAQLLRIRTDRARRATPCRGVQPRWRALLEPRPNLSALRRLRGGPTRPRLRAMPRPAGLQRTPSSR